jgi:hypothetical protein
MHINFTAIFYIVIGVVMWQVLPGVLSNDQGMDALKSVLRILGILILIVGVFNFITSLF